MEGKLSHSEGRKSGWAPGALLREEMYGGRMPKQGETLSTRGGSLLLDVLFFLNDMSNRQTPDREV